VRFPSGRAHLGSQKERCRQKTASAKKIGPTFGLIFPPPRKEKGKKYKGKRRSWGTPDQGDGRYFKTHSGEGPSTPKKDDAVISFRKRRKKIKSEVGNG